MVSGAPIASEILELRMIIENGMIYPQMMSAIEKFCKGDEGLEH